MNISDSHTDFLTAIKDKNERKKYIEFCAKNGVKLMSCAIFTQNCDCSMQDIRNFNIELKELSKLYNIELLLSIEDLGFIKDYKELIELIEIKPFSVTLTWNYENQFAGGAKTDLGISELGRKTVALLEKNNIIVDTAHLSRNSFYDFAKITNSPLFNSHSNVDCLHHHYRNLTDKQIKMISDSKGFLGITIYDEFISNTAINSLTLFNQFNYLLQHFNINCFGFGTDLYGIDFEHTPIDIKNYKDLKLIEKHFKDKEYNKNTIQNVMFMNFSNFVKILK